MGTAVARLTDERRPAGPAQVPAHDERRPAGPAQVPAHDERRPAGPAQVPAHAAGLVVSFAGLPARRGPLTHAQRNVLCWLPGETDRWSSVIPVLLPVPPTATLAGVGGAVAALLRRHESRRSVFDADGQRVAGAGELVVAVHEATEDVAGVREELVREPFGISTGLPVRAAVLTCDGAPFLVVLVLSHIAVDHASVELLSAEFRALLRGAELPPPGPQPVDQAQFERSEPGLRAARDALEHWRARRAPGAPA